MHLHRLFQEQISNVTLSSHPYAGHPYARHPYARHPYARHANGYVTNARAQYLTVEMSISGSEGDACSLTADLRATKEKIEQLLTIYKARLLR